MRSEWLLIGATLVGACSSSVVTSAQETADPGAPIASANASPAVIQYLEHGIDTRRYRQSPRAWDDAPRAPDSYGQRPWYGWRTFHDRRGEWDRWSMRSWDGYRGYGWEYRRPYAARPYAGRDADWYRYGYAPRLYGDAWRGGDRRTPWTWGTDWRSAWRPDWRSGWRSELRPDWRTY